MKEKVLLWLAQISFGKPMAAALTILQLVMEAINTRQTRSLTRFVYQKLPANWRHPEGPATEKEFLDTIKAGETFLKALHKLSVS